MTPSTRSRTAPPRTVLTRTALLPTALGVALLASVAGAVAPLPHDGSSAAEDAAALTSPATPRAPLPGSTPAWTADAAAAVPADRPVSVRLLLPRHSSSPTGASDPGAAAGAALDPAVAAWLSTSGLEPLHADDGGAGAPSAVATLAVSGTAAAFERAFGTPLVSTEHDGTAVVRPAGTVSVPRSVAGQVLDVAGTVQAPTYRALHTAGNGSTATDPLPAPTPSAPGSSRGLRPMTVTTADTCARYWGETVSDRWPAGLRFEKRSNWICGYTPQDLRAIHAVPDDQTGRGARIGIVAAYDDPAVEQNTNDYFTQVGAAPLHPGQYVHHAPTDPDTAVCGGPETWTDEQHLDVQAVHAVAPDASIVYWGARSCYSVDLFDTILQAATSGQIDALSLSFGSTEELDTAADRELLNRALVEAAARGVSVFAASGNDGDYSAAGDHPETDVTSPASSPWVTAVGGLSIGLRRDGAIGAIAGWATTPYFARNGGLIPPGFDSGTGGGPSALYAAPTWQLRAAGIGTAGTGPTARHVPDVSSLGDPSTGFTVRTTTPDGPEYRSLGGTSLATPVVTSLVATAKASAHLRIGLATPWLYALQGTDAVRDVVPQSAAVWSIHPVDRGQTFPETVYAWDRKPQSLQSGPGWDALSGVGMPTGEAFFRLFGATR